MATRSRKRCRPSAGVAPASASQLHQQTLAARDASLMPGLTPLMYCMLFLRVSVSDGSQRQRSTCRILLIERSHNAKIVTSLGQDETKSAKSAAMTLAQPHLFHTVTPVAPVLAWASALVAPPPFSEAVSMRVL